MWSYLPGARTATRVVVTHTGELPGACELLRTAKDVPVLVYVAAENVSNLQSWRDAGAEVVGLATVGGTLSPLAILDDLGRRRFTNVLVEGGGGSLGAFHDAEAIDETWVFVAPKLLGGEGSRSPLGGVGRSMATIDTALESHHESFGADLLIRSVFTAP